MSLHSFQLCNIKIIGPTLLFYLILGVNNCYSQQLISTNYYFNSTVWNTLPNDIIHTSDNSFLIAGSAYLTGGINRYSLIKTDESGNVLWFYPDTSNSPGSEAYCVRELSNGNYIIAGAQFNFYESMFVITFDTNGFLLYQNTYSDSTDYNFASALELNGSLYIFGVRRINHITSSTTIIKTDLQGNILATFNDTTFIVGAESNAVILDDNNFILTGFSFQDSTQSSYYPVIVKLDSNLQQVWLQTYPVQSHSNSKQISRAIDGGYAMIVVNPDMLIKTDSLGNEEWRVGLPGSYPSLLSVSSGILISYPQLELYWYDLNGLLVDTSFITISPHGPYVARTILKGDTLVFIEGVQNGSAPIYSSSLLALVRDTLLFNGVYSMMNNNKFLIYPSILNRGGYVNIKGNSLNFIKCNLYDLQGKPYIKELVIESANSDLYQLKISSSLTTGIYILEIIENGYIYRTKLIIM